MAAMNNEPGTSYVLFSKLNLGKIIGISEKTRSILNTLTSLNKGNILIILLLDEENVEYILKNASTPSSRIRLADGLFDAINELELDGLAVIIEKNLDSLTTADRETVINFINTLYPLFEAKGKIIMKRETNSLGRDIWSIGSEKNITNLLPAIEVKSPPIISREAVVTTENTEEIITRRRKAPNESSPQTETTETTDPKNIEEGPREDPPAEKHPSLNERTPPSLQLPVIIGFSSPNDVFNPGTNVKSLIESQLEKGMTEIPIYSGGNVTPDGTTLSLAGSNPPDLKNFMDMLNQIELEQKLPANTIRLRPYIRASVTSSDTSQTANPNSPGKVTLSNPHIRSNLISLIKQISNGQRFNINGDRIDEITLDFEDTTASNYDPKDVDPGDALSDSSVLTMATFIQELKQSGFTKKIGLYSLGILDPDWFPSETMNPGSPFAVSPRNFISRSDLITLFKSGLDVYEFAAYSTFPDANGAGGFADPETYGPIHTSYQNFLSHHLQEMRSIGKDPGEHLRILIPVYSDPNVVNLSTALSSLKNLISTGNTSKILGGVFDLGSLDALEKTMILNAIE